MQILSKIRKTIPASARGFTLVEMAIVILISGFIIGAILRHYSFYQQERQRQQTYENMADIQTAMTQFRIRFNRYPCPAALNLPQGDPNYGKEDCRIMQPPATGVCSNGFCRADGARDVDGTPGADPVLIGMVPIISLEKELNPYTFTLQDAPLRTSPTQQLPARSVLDGWGNKILYSVSENMTNAATFSNSQGVLSVTDEFDQTIVRPENSAHYVLTSFGKNGRGGYTSTGQQIAPDCSGVFVALPGPPVASGGVSIEFENCNNDELFISALRVDEPGNNYNDDIIFYENYSAAALWKVSSADPGAIHNVNLGAVGISNDVNFDPSEQLHVDGDIFVNNYTQTLVICDSTGNECFEPALLGGSGNFATEIAAPPLPAARGMKCSTNTKAMIGINTRQPMCDDIVFPPTAAGLTTPVCPVGKFVQAITNKGNLVCAFPP